MKKMQSSKLRPKIITFGNVLLDFTYSIEKNPGILSKYGFEPNGLGECTSKILQNVADDAEKSCEFLSSQTGGSALNTSKILTYLGESELIFCGSIGNDTNGTQVREHLNKVQLKACLQTFDTYATGTCVCLINKENRCCYANIGASIYFEKEFFQGQNLIDTLHKQIFYIEGFFITGNRFSVCKYVIDEVSQPFTASRIFSTNLSAEYLIESHPEQIKYLAENATILFGNKDEFDKLAEAYKMPDAENVITHLINTKSTEEKIIICTQGPGSVLYSQSSKMIINEEFHFDTVPKEKIVDTTGCGDAFVAGFFYAFLRNKAIVDCVAKGVETALIKITSIGGTFSKHL